MNKTYKSIITQIVEVQPMTVPTGAIFYLDFVYESKEEAKQARLAVVTEKCPKCGKKCVSALTNTEMENQIIQEVKCTACDWEITNLYCYLEGEI